MHKVMKNLAVLAFFAMLYTFISYTKEANPLFVPKVDTIVSDYITLFANGMLFKGIFQSFWRITLATGISCLISIPLALIIYSSKTVDELISPIANMLRYVPTTAFGPLLILWVGIDENMKITFLFCATFFYFLPSMVLNIKEIDKRLIETAYTMGMSKTQVILKVVVPYTLPGICKSILMMYGIGWSYIVVAESINTTSGLGYLINIGSARGRTDMVFMSIITIMAISFIIDAVGNHLIAKKFSWKFKKQDESLGE